jgi:hypothetical protein
MLRGNPGRLTSVLLAVVGITLGSGCQRLPVRDSGQNPPINQALKPSPVPAEPAPFPEFHANSAPLLPPTPLLDSALTRAHAFEATQNEDSPSYEEPERKPAASREVPASPSLTQAASVPDLAPDPSVKNPLAQNLEAVLKPVSLPVQEAKPIDPEKPVEPRSPQPEPGNDWDSELARLREVARRRADESGEQSEYWKRRLLLLEGLAKGKDFEGAWGSILSALPIVSGHETNDPTPASERLRQATEAIDARAPLEIVELCLCRKVQGFGVFETVDKDSLHAGQSTLIYCELSGLKSEVEDGEYHSRLSSRVEIVKSGDESPIWSEQLARKDRCRRRRRDVFVNYRFTVPSDIPPGDYEVRLTQTDELTGRSVAAAIEVRVLP